MFTAFYREVPHVKPVLFGKRKPAGNVVALCQPTHFNGMRIVSRLSDGSIEVESMHCNFLISPTGASVRIS